MDDETDRQAKRVGDDKAPGAHDLRRKLTNSAAFDGLDRLALDDADGGAGLSLFPRVPTSRVRC